VQLALPGFGAKGHETKTRYNLSVTQKYYVGLTLPYSNCTPDVTDVPECAEYAMLFFTE